MKIDCYRQPLEVNQLRRAQAKKSEPLTEDEQCGVCERLGGPAPECDPSPVCARFRVLPGGQEDPRALAIFSLWMDLLRMRSGMGDGLGIGGWYINAQTEDMEPWERRMLAQDLSVLEAWRSEHMGDKSE